MRCGRLPDIADRSPIADVPLLAVGDRTALEAKRAGFAAARSAGGAVDDLATLAGAELDPAAGPLLYVAGEVIAGDLAGQLRSRGFDVRTLVLYRAVARTRLAGVARTRCRPAPPTACSSIRRGARRPSPRRSRAEGLAPLGRHIACFCLSAPSPRRSPR